VTRRDAAVCLFCVLTVAAVAGVARAVLTSGRPGPAPVLLAGAGLLCGLYAVLGWSWFLFTGVLR
jgi:hypothetical protein